MTVSLKQCLSPGFSLLPFGGLPFCIWVSLTCVIHTCLPHAWSCLKLWRLFCCSCFSTCIWLGSMWMRNFLGAALNPCVTNQHSVFPLLKLWAPPAPRSLQGQHLSVDVYGMLCIDSKGKARSHTWKLDPWQDLASFSASLFGLTFWFIHSPYQNSAGGLFSSEPLW